MTNAEALLEKIQALPSESQGKVEALIDTLAARAGRRAATDRFLAIAPALEAAGAPPMTEEEIQAEVDAVRAERRARISGANPS